jgi:hypothetical protein
MKLTLFYFSHSITRDSIKNGEGQIKIPFNSAFVGDSKINTIVSD